MFQNMTPGDLLMLAFGGLLALASIVSTVGGAVEKIVKLRKAAKAETKSALQTVYDSLNHGQQNKLIKDEAVKALFDLYGVNYE